MKSIQKNYLPNILHGHQCIQKNSGKKMLKNLKMTTFVFLFYCILIEYIKKIVKLLDSDRKENIAIAAYDLGEFCRFHSFGKT